MLLRTLTMLYKQYVKNFKREYILLEVKAKILTAKKAFSRKKHLLCSKVGLGKEIRKSFVVNNCIISNEAFT